MDSRRFSIWLVICLLVSNLAVGALSLFFLKELNGRYTELFEHSIPVVNNLRTLTRELSHVQRLARRIVDPANEPTWKELLPQMTAANAKVRALALEISRADLFRTNDNATLIADMSRDYEAKVQDYLVLARSDRLAQANRFNIEVLRPAYDDYQARVEEAAEFVERHANELRLQYTRDSRIFGGLLLMLGGWPLLVGAIFVCGMALIVVSLLITVFIPRFDLSRRLFRTETDQ